MLRPDPDAEHPPAATTAPAAASPLQRAGLASIALMLALIAGGVAHTLFAPNRRALTDFFFYEQDLQVAGAFIVAFAVLGMPWRWRLPFELRPPAATWRTVLVVALLVVVAGYTGSYLVYDNYALSMDEFMARFDAQILATGQLAAPVPPEWRDYVKALQPIFMLDIPGHAYWVSNYLPVNAAFLALGLKLGVMNLVPALWAGIGVVATFGVARRLWPEKPGVGLIAVALLATSPQLIITAMTPYAMSAHLALNMVWLWLFLRGGRLGHGAAAGVAFLATGLHQLVFHPLFAAPFVLELWLAKRWKPALWHTAAFAVIGAFWALYQPMVIQLYGAGTVAQAAQGHGALALLIGLLAEFQPAAIGYIAKNLIRMITWQNLLLTPLVLMGIVPAIRAGGTLRAFVLGVALTLFMLVVVMPYQGHGWGYRYLHGFLGAFCLLAAWGWVRLSDADLGEAAVRRFVFACAAAATLLLLLPLRAWQTHAFEQPYAAAMRQIEATDAEVVMVENAGVWFGADLVRNTPDLSSRRVVVAVGALSPVQWQALCAGRTMAWFTRDDAERLGVRGTSRSSSRSETGC